MIIIPAIDLKDGKVVRLFQGEYNKVTSYDTSPVDAARHWEKLGAQWLHVVDLDGAKDGKIKNFQLVEDIAKSVNIPVEMGGGVREEKDIERLLNIGIQRVIVGTKVWKDNSFLKKILSRWGNKIAVSLDSTFIPPKNRNLPAEQNSSATQVDFSTMAVTVGTQGWTDKSKIELTYDSEQIRELNNSGLSCLIFTDITKDGTLTGPNLNAIEYILTITKVPLIVAGGISSIEDVRKLINLQKKYPLLKGAITGKAIYEGKLNFKEAIEICSQNG